MMPRRTSSGRTSAALPSRAIESGREALRASSASLRASSRLRRGHIAVPRLEAPLDPVADRLRPQIATPSFMRHGQRLGPAHPAESGRDDQPAGERAAEMLPGDGGEGLVRPLQDALGADIDPAARRSSARTWSGRALRDGGTRPRWPISGRGWRWR